ncbi:LYR motif-containing protein 4-like [Glycine soja]|uniref:LYR motif-containing protein 4 n=1 Tax=Glycine soja TaxID=3848 RepID=A0A445JJF8_GLYSO|nr:LYR motif-containing protein 4-like [Glycine soja]XP_028245375.1 LYR motif-containing protein 4-like [Glycine soja]RZB98590.1 LYR motif-containing protein 4 [Glycine soja]
MIFLDLPSIHIYSLTLYSILYLEGAMSAAASSSATPSAAQVLSLFRSLLRAAREFPDYNIREYTKRRTIDSFRHNATLSDPSQISTAFAHGKSQLAVVKRQAVVYSLYDSPLRSVMELQQVPF